jgi:hypothetical protein
MKINFHLPTFIITALVFSLIFLAGFTFTQQDNGYILNHEKDIAVADVGPHNGGVKVRRILSSGSLRAIRLRFVNGYCIPVLLSVITCRSRRRFTISSAAMAKCR